MKKTFKEFLQSKSIAYNAFLKEDAEKQAELYNEYNQEIREAIAKAVEKLNAGQTDNAKLVASLKESLESIKDQQIKVLNQSLEKMGLEISKMKEGQEHQAKKPTLKKSLQGNLQGLKEIKEKGKSDWLKLSVSVDEVKVPAAMTFGNVSGGNIPVEERIPGFNLVPVRRLTLLEVMQSRTITGNVISWVDQANRDGSAGQTTEGTDKNQIDFDLVVRNDSLKKTTAFIKVSTEMLEDIDYLEQEIRRELFRSLLLAVEDTTFSGDGLGNNHTGIYEVAVASDMSLFADSVDNANAIDVLRVAMNQIKLANQSEPSAIFLAPTELTRLSLLKATDNQYIDAIQEIKTKQSLDNVPIIDTTLVSGDNYLIGDFSKAISVSKGEVTLDIGLDSDDFKKNLRTILAEWRGLTLVKENDKTAFVKGDLSVDAALLETP